MAGAFSVLVLLIVCPVAPLLVMAGHGIAGAAGAWTVTGLLAVSPALAAWLNWVRFRP